METPIAEIVLSGQTGQYIRLRALDVIDPYYTTINIEVVMRAASGRFNGHAADYLYLHDLVNLRDELVAFHRALKGSFEFATLNEWFRMRFEYLTFGHVQVACTVRGGTFDEVSMTIHYETDQSYLPAIIEFLNEIEAYCNALHPPRSRVTR